MRLFSGRSGQHPTSRKARKRIDRIGQAEALLWTDNAGSQMSRGLSEYQRTGEAFLLEDARQAALMLVGCIESLQARQG